VDRPICVVGVIRGVALCGREAGCEVVAEHGAGSGEQEDKQNRHCHAPILDVAATRPLSRGGESTPSGLGLGKRTRGTLGPRVVGPEGSGSTWFLDIKMKFGTVSMNSG